MTYPSTVTRRPIPTAQRIGAGMVAVLAAAAWFAWMGWDSEYQVDPVTRVASGPYEQWQVVGFTAAWTWTAGREDETGLFGVGAIMVAVGLSMATAACSGIALVIRHGHRALKRRSASAA